MLYELIIFTMMEPHIEPKWSHMEPTSEIVCIERKLKFEKIFTQVDKLIFSVSCKVVENENKSQT